MTIYCIRAEFGTYTQHLVALRNTIPPKLMSGEVRIDMDAVAKMEEA
jgi:hypothetical protein